MGNRRSPIIQDPACGRCIFGSEPYAGVVRIDTRARVIAPSWRRNSIGIIAGAADRKIGQHIWTSSGIFLRPQLNQERAAISGTSERKGTARRPRERLLANQPRILLGVAECDGAE